MTLQLASIENLVTGEKIEVQFNPTELAFTKTAQLAEIAIPGLDSPVIQFIRGGAETVTVELFFDTTDDGMGDGATSVTERTDKFYQLVKQDSATHAPPRCRFYWGQAPGGATFTGSEASKAPFWFTCVVESVDRKFLLFSPEGTPLRARLGVKLREYKTIDEMVAQLESADHTKAHVLKRRERLDQISARAYETPAEWRRIAEENELDDPLRLEPGTILKVPPIRTPSVTRGRR